MSEWIRHRGSKSMPKCLEGKRFQVRFRSSRTADDESVGDWSHMGVDSDIMAYRITGDINLPDYTKGFPVWTTSNDIGAKVGDEFVSLIDYNTFKKGDIIKLAEDDKSDMPYFSKDGGMEIGAFHCMQFSELAPIPQKTAIELQAEEVGIAEQEWPEDRVDVVGQNGNDGLHYDADGTNHITPAAVNVLVDLGVESPTTAPAFLQSAINTLTQRGEDYDKPEGERSASAVAVAFNAITGRNLTEAEVWLVLQLVKDVRQWQNPDRYHADSALDCVAYAALKAEALAKGGE